MILEPRESYAHRAAQAALATAAFVFVAWYFRDFAPVDWETVRGVGALAAIGAVLSCAIRIGFSRTAWMPAAASAICAVLLTWTAAPWECRMLAAMFAASTMAWIGAGGGAVPRGAPPILCAFAAARLLIDGALPEAEQLAESTLAVMTGRVLDWKLGPTACGLGLVASGFLWVLRPGSGATRRVRVLGVLTLFAAWMTYFGTLPAVAAGKTAAPIFDHLTGLGAGIALILGMFEASIRAPQPPSPEPLRSAPALALGSAALLLFAGAIASGVSPMGIPREQHRIRVFNRGGLDWDRPQYGRFGGFTGGMFGLLPQYVKSAGFDFDVIDRDTVSAESLRETDTLVMINCPKVWSADERSTIEQFVHSGGNLLVLGDHTNVFGLRDGLNPLLEPFGITFRFDSAYHARTTWKGSIEVSPHALGQPWGVRPPGIGIGASLELAKGARPLAVARYAHSDLGVAENTIGAFLGNYALDAGELVGDLPVVAWAHAGKGRVVVYGDTTTFQNSSAGYLEKSEIVPLLRWLGECTTILDDMGLRRAVGLGSLLLLIWACIARHRLVTALAMAVLLGCALPARLAQARWSYEPTLDRNCALIDDELLPATGHYEAGLNSIGPLYSTLQRAGYIIRIAEKYERGAVGRVGCYALVAPQRRLGSERIRELLDAMEGGTRVVLAVGHREADSVAPLLHALDLDLLPHSLGPVPPDLEKADLDAKPRFLDPSPLLLRDRDGKARPLQKSENVEILFRYGEHALAAHRRVGKGGLILFGDPRFFASRNIEDVSWYSLGNLKFLYGITKQFLGRDPDTVAPIFPNPPALQ
ncbi:MAG: hypothetical protein JNJ88_14125 [Planctomycetes bacterium]|nr:hypothetical protein [Planctomycetota bacterium]